MSENTEPNADDVRAGEYALGIGDEGARQAVERDIRSDVQLAEAVRAWDGWLKPLWSGFRSANPPPAVWTRIEQAISAETPQQSNLPRRVMPGRSSRLRDRWAAGAIGFAVAAGIAGVIVLGQARPRLSPLVTALLPKSDGAPVLVGERTANGSLVFRTVGDVSVPSGKDFELWSVPAGAKRPVGLAVLRSGEAIVPSDHVPTTGVILLSLEPRGGSPTGLPTGPVVSGGRVATAE